MSAFLSVKVEQSLLKRRWTVARVLPQQTSGVALTGPWARFEALNKGGGHPVSGDLLTKAIHASALHERIHWVRRTLVGLRYCVEKHRAL